MRNALRMRPDRIIVGEVRGGEAFDMMQAMNTGHNGSMSTVHANSARDALARIENMILMGTRQPADPGDPHADRQRARPRHANRAHARRRSPRDRGRRSCRTGRRHDHPEHVVHVQIRGRKLDGMLRGRFESRRGPAAFYPRVEYFGLGAALLRTLGIGRENFRRVSRMLSPCSRSCARLRRRRLRSRWACVGAAAARLERERLDEPDRRRKERPAREG